MPIDPTALNIVEGHPGIMTLIVSMATAGVLAFSLPSIIKASVIGRAFELLGRYSYSIYLVHFPVLVLALYQPFSGTQIKPEGVGLTLILVVLIAALSLLSFHGVEKLGARIYSSRRAIGVVSGIFLLTFIAPKIIAFTYSDTEDRIFEAWTDRSTYRCGKIFRIFNPGKIACEVTKNINVDAPKLLLVGNSHADAIKTSFANVSTKLGYHLYFLVANNPLLTPKLDVQRLTREAKALGVTAVIIHFTLIENFEQSIEAFRATLATKGIRVVLLMPVPTYSTHIPSALYRNHIQGTPLPKINLEEYYKESQTLFDYARLQEAPAFSFYDIGAVLCQPECRITDNQNRPAYFDEGHLTLSGAQMLEGLFSQAISGLTETK
ncbi:MAG: acyltransferase [Rhizobiaceae bacterium]|nr:acyltransferase [Rhizobiaceae bacterium]